MLVLVGMELKLNQKLNSKMWLEKRGGGKVEKGIKMNYEQFYL